jgi:hypothetical protein
MNLPELAFAAQLQRDTLVSVIYTIVLLANWVYFVKKPFLVIHRS